MLLILDTGMNAPTHSTLNGQTTVKPWVSVDFMSMNSRYRKSIVSPLGDQMVTDKPINVIIRVQCQQNFQEKRRGANQSNLLNIPVDIFVAKTTSHGTLNSTIHGNNSQKSKVIVAHLSVRSLKTREHLIQVRNLMDEKKYAILAISESWLNSSVKNAEVEIDGYSFSRLDRPRKHKEWNWWWGVRVHAQDLEV